MPVFEPALAPLAIKEQLCRDLLEEFGAVSIRQRPDRNELIHGCLVGTDHTDQSRNPTASLNYEKLTYRCLGCQARGGILWLIAKVRNCTWEEARTWLNTATGSGGETMSLAQLLEFVDALNAPPPSAVPMPSHSRDILDPWLNPSHPYLVSRGITSGTAEAFRLGYDQTDDCVVIPHFWEQELVGWQKRRLSGAGPKYVSTPGMPKDATLFNYDGKATTAVLVESPMSVLRHAPEIHMEATFGASVTDSQVKLATAHYERLVLWMDNDPAGWTATRSIIERASPHCPVWVVDSPFEGDPGDLSRTEAKFVMEEFTIPAIGWDRPRVLFCRGCLSPVHAGPCERNDDGDA